MHALATKLSPAQNEASYFEALEWNFQKCDEVTRRTGRLTKQVRLVDLQGEVYTSGTV
jgi:hypothetical protein